MKITAISDLHGFLPKDLPGGDLLIIAGDLTARDKKKEYIDFNCWSCNQDYEKIIVIAGNHDKWIENQVMMSNTFYDCEYLCDSYTKFMHLKIWGSPWSPWFQGVNPKCEAFMIPENYIKDKYDLIPSDIDILITHCPPLGILDSNMDSNPCGSSYLRNIVLSSERFPKLKLHIFGHIHEQGGKIFETPLCKFVNASVMNEFYIPKNKIISFEI